MNADERKHIETAKQLKQAFAYMREYKNCSENIADLLNVLSGLPEAIEYAIADYKIEHDAEQEVFARERRKEIEFKNHWILPA